MANDKQLIDANDVYSLFDRSGFARMHLSDIDTIPRVNAVEVVRHGRCKKSDGKDEWYTYYYTCVECGANMMVADADYHDVSPNYCPNCGAKMDVDVEKKEGAD